MKLNKIQLEHLEALIRESVSIDTIADDYDTNESIGMQEYGIRENLKEKLVDFIESL